LASGHPDVHEDDVGTQAPAELDRLLAVTGKTTLIRRLLDLTGATAGTMRLLWEVVERRFAEERPGESAV
jgi:hypothetical protein